MAVAGVRVVGVGRAAVRKPGSARSRMKTAPNAGLFFVAFRNVPACSILVVVILRVLRRDLLFEFLD